MSAATYGTVAEFETAETVLAAAKSAREYGYVALDAFTPFPVEGLADAIGFTRTRVPLIVLLSGIFGGALGYGMQAYSAIWDYRLNVGGRPAHSWPSFIVIAFELTILCAAIGAVFGMLILNGLPRLHHPVFNTPHFRERNPERFYLCVLASDPNYEVEALRSFFASQNPVAVWEVET